MDTQPLGGAPPLTTLLGDRRHTCSSQKPGSRPELPSLLGIQQKPPGVGALGDTKAMTWTQQPILASPKGLKGQGTTCWGVASPARL